MRDYLAKLLREPPFRLFAQRWMKSFRPDLRTQVAWDVNSYPGYWFGVLAAADQAREEGRRHIAVIEFGVAGGRGLVALQDAAAAVERVTDVTIEVHGFDAGGGMPELCGDYRDHPDHWQAGDYRMDVAALRARLTPGRTSLHLGPFAETVPMYAATNRAAIGFAAIDVDLWSSTVDVLPLFQGDRRQLRRTVLLLDDVNYRVSHRWAGELLAVDEFNDNTPDVKIDRWRGLAASRIFPNADWLDKVYVAHDLAAISGATITRKLKEFALE